MQGLLTGAALAAATAGDAMAVGQTGMRPPERIDLNAAPVPPRPAPSPSPRAQELARPRVATPGARVRRVKQGAIIPQEAAPARPAPSRKRGS